MVFLTPISVFIGAAVFAGTYRPEIPLSGLIAGAHCERVDDHHIRCTAPPPPLGLPGLPPMRLANLTAHPTGPVFSGSLTRTRDASAAAVSVRAVDTEFVWSDEAGCNAQASFHSVATFTIQNAGGSPLFICAVTPLNDPARVYERARITGVRTDPLPPGSSARIRLAIPDWVVAEALAGPLLGQLRIYSAQLLVRTSGGCRLIEIPTGPAGLDDATRERLAEFRRVSCTPVRDVARQLSAEGQFRLPIPLGDPPPDGIWAVDVWQVILTGLTAGAPPLTLYADDVSLTVHVDGVGALVATLVTAPRAQPQLRRGDAEAERTDKLGLYFAQHRYAADVAIEVAETARILDYEPDAHGGQVLLADGARLMWWSLPLGAVSPTTVLDTVVDGLTGGVLMGDAVIALGGEGVQRLTPKDSSIVEADVGAIHTLVRTPHGLVIAGEQSCVLLTDGGSQQVLFDGKSTSAAWLADALVLLREGGLVMQQIDRDGKPLELAEVSLESLIIAPDATMRLTAVGLPWGGHHALQLQTTDEWLVVALNDPHKVVCLARGKGTTPRGHHELVGGHLLTVENAALVRAPLLASARL